jgi:hypothetical protein
MCIAEHCHENESQAPEERERAAIRRGTAIDCSSATTGYVYGVLRTASERPRRAQMFHVKQ